MKKVIFIGGTSFSGSTVLDMTLANDPHGFSCGEVNAMFYPYRSHHIAPECGCGKNSCNIWKETKSSGVRNLYTTIFKLFPNVEYIIDSSKDPYWIETHSRQLRTDGFDVKNVLIWKTPLEFAQSCNKRNRLPGWEQTWTDYHRLYFSLIPNFHLISYRDFTNEEFALKNLCRQLQISYFDSKKMFWQKEHHTLFGNTSAKIHLYNKDSETFKNAKKELVNTVSNSTNTIPKKYKNIYYDDVNDKTLINHVKQGIDTNPYINTILKILHEDVITHEFELNSRISQLKYNRNYLTVKRFYRALKCFMKKFIL